LIFKEFDRLGRPVASLKHIVLTHAHRSHLGGLATLKRVSGATIWAHEWEADIIAGDRKAQPVTLRPKPPLRTLPQRIGLAAGVSAPGCPVDRFLKDGDRVGPIQVMHTPGHTPGHLVMYWPERQALFTGDKIATWPRMDSGWAGFQLNEAEFRKSFIRMVTEFYPRVQILGVGHGEPVARDATSEMRALVADLKC
jgi:glyoxylase-like metal-dependent hydrolase (beta-lactamase superfamily II)